MTNKRYFWVLYTYNNGMRLVCRYGTMGAGFGARGPEGTTQELLHGNHLIVRRIQKRINAGETITFPMLLED